MSDLTPKQERFVKALLTAPSFVDAYTQVYDWKGGRDGAYVAAHRLARDAKIRRRVKEYAKMVRKTLDDHLAELERLKAKSAETGNMGASVRAEELQGKALGFYVDRHQISDTSSMSNEELVAQIAAIDQEAADRIAEKLGIKDNVVPIKGEAA